MSQVKRTLQNQIYSQKTIMQQQRELEPNGPILIPMDTKRTQETLKAIDNFQIAESDKNYLKNAITFCDNITTLCNFNREDAYNGTMTRLKPIERL